jgi:hypothetical protein
MIANAIENGEDTTGLCTVREVAALLIADAERRAAENNKAGYTLPLACEMFFCLSGDKVNVEVKVTSTSKEPQKAVPYRRMIECN